MVAMQMASTSSVAIAARVQVVPSNTSPVPLKEPYFRDENRSEISATLCKCPKGLAQVLRALSILLHLNCGGDGYFPDATFEGMALIQITFYRFHDV